MNQPKIAPEKLEFYRLVIKLLKDNKLPFMIGGTYALGEHADIYRETKDLDIFCKPSDHMKILKLLDQQKIKSQLLDDRWIAKAIRGRDYVDLIFNSPSGLTPVEETWFKRAPISELFGFKVKIVPVEEMIISKMYFRERDHFDGADVNHMILKKGKDLDWKRIVSKMDPHWEVLLEQLIDFRFVYPSNRDKVPKWLMEELVSRLQYQLNIPSSQDKVCRGPLLARHQYEIDINEWGYKVIT